jgi:sulfite exporter TauE/SafE
MDWGIVATALVFGLTASISCLGLCIPILVPYIMEKDKTLKEGFFTSITFSVGRLIIYFTLGLVVFMLGTLATQDAPRSWLKIAVAVLGCAVILYGIWIVFRLPKPKWCPAKLADNFRPAFSVILGLLIGSFFCPLLWFTLVGAALTKDLLTMFFSVMVFWMGSSVTIIPAGTLSGGVGGRWRKKIGVEKLRDICGMVLMMVGVFYLINAFL